MEGNGEIRYLSEVFDLLFLDAHFENLALCRSVDERISHLFHASNGEEGGAVLFCKVSVPFSTIFCVYLEGKVALVESEGIAKLTCHLVVTEASRAVGNHEVVTLEGQNVLNTEVSARGLGQHELEFAGLVTEKNLASICADK